MDKTNLMRIYSGVAVLVLISLGAYIYGAFFMEPGKRVEGASDLQISSVADKESVKVGDMLTYTHTVKNWGALDAKTITITDDLPFGVDVVSISIDSGECQVLAEVPLCDIDELKGDETVTLTLVVKVESVLDTNTIVNVAKVASANNENEPMANNNAYVTTYIEKKMKVGDEEEIYTGFSCGFEQVVLHSDIGSPELSAQLLPETTPANGLIAFAGAYPSYQANGVALFPGALADTPANNYIIMYFTGEDDSLITLRGVVAETGFQLCTGTFTKGGTPEGAGMVPAGAY